MPRASLERGFQGIEYEKSPQVFDPRIQGCPEPSVELISAISSTEFKINFLKTEKSESEARGTAARTSPEKQQGR